MGIDPDGEGDITQHASSSAGTSRNEENGDEGGLLRAVADRRRRTLFTSFPTSAI